MASNAARSWRGGRPSRPITPDRFERVLAAGAVVILVMTLAALIRGHADWPSIPGFVLAHLVTIIIALALTPTMLLRPRGDRLHRRFGWIWSAALFLTALLSFGIRQANGGLSAIHILSAWTLIQVPLIVWSAKRHRVATHRSAVRGMVLGALLIAGAFTFPFGRLLGQLLFR